VSETVRIELLPLGRGFEVKRGTPLQDFLFAHGVEFPCGGRGRCKGCKVRLLEGSLAVTAEERQRLTEAELVDGWRLACRHRAAAPLRLDLAQWEAAILADDTVFAFTPQDGLGVAIDLGTTTLVAQLLDLHTGRVLAVRTALNAQARFGADILSRIDFAVMRHGHAQLEKTIHEQLGQMIADLLTESQADAARLRQVVIVGNTVMHHLFCGLSLEPLSHVPFETPAPGLQLFHAADLGWQFAPKTPVRFLPCLGSFVGSDILAGVLATRLHESEELVALVDLGTNGEIIVGNRHRMLCTSTAAGPAFEGARISVGMRAATGAIAAVRVEKGALACDVLGRVQPRGICGSGLVDAVACALDLGWVSPTGRFFNREVLKLRPPVQLIQADIRELQLAKGAIAAGLRLLCRQLGATLDDLARVHLAGAFGNYINMASARRIGLLELPAEKIQPAGNTALLGAKLALFDLAKPGADHADILRNVRHVSLNEDPAFQDVFVECMTFPANGR
jgi:uncharacterized 2Fe-2S/4Fe-4S cluster protein (DUF4445 family)